MREVVVGEADGEVDEVRGRQASAASDPKQRHPSKAPPTLLEDI